MSTSDRKQQDDGHVTLIFDLGRELPYLKDMVSMSVEFLTNLLGEQQGPIEEGNIDIARPRNDGVVAHSTE